MALHNELGKWGEEVAANLLKQKNYRIVQQNWRTGHMEVDIIAENSQTVAFVEVKTRTTRFGNKMPEEYVDKEKEANICHAAHIFIKKYRISKQIRFDVISILADHSTNQITRLEHIENAFYPPLRTITENSYSGQNRWHTKKKRRGL